MSRWPRFGASRMAGASVRTEPPVTAPQASAEASGTAAPKPWLQEVGWSSGGASRIRTLPRVSADVAQRHATVYACCAVIAGDLAKVPLKLFQRTGDGREVRVRDHAAPYLLNVEAAPGVAASVVRFALGYAFTLRGNAFAWAPRDGAGELELIDLVRQSGCSVLRAGRDRFYDFEDGAGLTELSEFVLTDLPPYADAVLKIEALRPGGTVSIGQLVCGPLWPVGRTAIKGSGFQGVDFSYVAQDEFGDLTTVRRAATRLSSFEVWVENARLLGLDARLRTLRGGTAAVWIGDDDPRKAAMNYGFYRGYRSAYQTDAWSLLQIDVQGIV